MKRRPNENLGFTIVELIVVVAVVAILAGVVVIGYGAWRNSITSSAVKSDLTQAQSAMANARNFGNGYPTSLPASFESSTDIEVTYISGDDKAYCIEARSTKVTSIVYHINTSESPDPQIGTCSGATGPVVVYPSTWKEVSAGGGHTCAIGGDDKIYCWGANQYGQLGNASNTDSSIPVPVTMSGVLSGKTPASIVAGNDYACVVATDQRAYCWGRNNNGQLGDGSYVDSNVPVAVSTAGVMAGRNVTKLAAASNTCAVASGAAFCWGYGGFGSLGNASSANSNVPVAVSTAGVMNGLTVTDISVGGGYSFSCAVASSRAFCWGSGSYYSNLGNGGTTNSNVPVAVTSTGVLAGRNVTQIGVGYMSACVLADALPFCWGRDGSGQLGNGSITGDQPSPVATELTGSGITGRTFTQLSVGPLSSAACALMDNQRVSCWGGSSNGMFGRNSTSFFTSPSTAFTSAPLSGQSITRLSTGTSHACVISSGQIYCAGSNFGGKLGNNSTVNSSVPVLLVTQP